VTAAARAEPRRLQILPRLGLRPATADVLRSFLDESLPAGGANALDAGCGRQSALAAYSPRIAHLAGVDLHPPDRPLPWLDRFVIADLCRDAGAFTPESFDVALSSFTVEHFADPEAAFRVVRGWLRPGGWLILTTVNRRHPFVDAYLSLPTPLRARLQRLVKASAADAHPLVGRCNRPDELRAALSRAGYADIDIVTTDHLARAWARRLPTYLCGLAGDLAAHGVPARRSTIVARARRPPA
jgi:SAM-dependent methyltransferase